MVRMRELRKERGMTLSQVSKALNIGLNTLAVYEREEHEAGYDILLKMSRLYGVTIDYLLGYSNDLITQQEALALNQAKEVFLQSLKPVEKQIIDNMLILSELKKYQLLGYIESIAKA